MPICLKCNSKIPNSMIIDGKLRNLQRRKFCLVCSPFGEHNNKSILPSSSDKKICTSCKKEFPATRKYFYYHSSAKNILAPNCISCRNSERTARYKEVKKQCISYKGGKCCKCGYNKCDDALDFHHLNPSVKEFGISQIRYRSFDSIKKELDKCILVCSNCHREIHGGA